MRKKALLFFTLFVCLSSCTGLKEELSGQLDVFTSFQIKTDNKIVNIPTGQHKMNVDFVPGVVNVKQAKIVMKSKSNQIYTINIPNEAFDVKKKSIVASSAQIGQTFSISALQTVRPLNTMTKVIKESCTFCGYCLTTGLDSKGQPESKYDNSCSCSGEREANYEITEYGVSYNIDFLESSNAKIATFRSSQTKKSERKFLAEIKSCQ